MNAQETKPKPFCLGGVAGWGKGRHSQERNEMAVRNMTQGDYILIIKARTEAEIPLEVQMIQKLSFQQLLLIKEDSRKSQT